MWSRWSQDEFIALPIPQVGGELLSPPHLTSLHAHPQAGQHEPPMPLRCMLRKDALPQRAPYLVGAHGLGSRTQAECQSRGSCTTRGRPSPPAAPVICLPLVDLPWSYLWTRVVRSHRIPSPTISTVCDSELIGSSF